MDITHIFIPAAIPYPTNPLPMQLPGRTNTQGRMNFALKSARAEAENKKKSTNSSV